MKSIYESYVKNMHKSDAAPTGERPLGKFKQKLNYFKRMIREYCHENAALVDELDDLQTQIIIKQEERKFLLRKLCEYEPQIAAEVQNVAKAGHQHQQQQQTSTTNLAAFNSNNDSKKGNNNSKRKRMLNTTSDASSSRKSIVKSTQRGRNNNRSAVAAAAATSSVTKPRKKLVQPIPLDSTGRPLLPIELGKLTIHSLGEVRSDPSEFHTEDVIYPVGFISTRIYGSLKDPTIKCIYTCKISEVNGLPKFEISSDDNCCAPIIGDTPDVCHALLLQRINDALSLNVVSTRPRGNDFFGLTQPIVLNLLQSFSGARKCTNYKWNRFEVSKSGDAYTEHNDASFNYDSLQRGINLCKYKMAPDILEKPCNDDYLLNSNNKGSLQYFLN